MNSYETLYAIKPTLEEEERAALIARFAGIIADNGGEVENTDEWGMRKLAYSIHYKNEGDYADGYYVLVNFKAPSELPAELERNFKITDAVMRFIVVRKDEK